MERKSDGGNSEESDIIDRAVINEHGHDSVVESAVVSIKKEDQVEPSDLESSAVLVKK